MKLLPPLAFLSLPTYPINPSLLVPSNLRPCLSHGGTDLPFPDSPLPMRARPPRPAPPPTREWRPATGPARGGPAKRAAGETGGRAVAGRPPECRLRVTARGSLCLRVNLSGRECAGLVRARVRTCVTVCVCARARAAGLRPCVLPLSPSPSPPPLSASLPACLPDYSLPPPSRLCARSRCITSNGADLGTDAHPCGERRVPGRIGLSLCRCMRAAVWCTRACWAYRLALPARVLAEGLLQGLCPAEIISLSLSFSFFFFPSLSRSL